MVGSSVLDEGRCEASENVELLELVIGISNIRCFQIYLWTWSTSVEYREKDAEVTFVDGCLGSCSDRLEKASVLKLERF